MNRLRVHYVLGTALIVFAITAAGQISRPSNPAVDQRRIDPLFSGTWEDYLRDNPEAATALDDKRYNDRYITWPVQALGCKIGQLQLLELPARAQLELGPKFDMKKFHDLILGSEAFPLDVLDRHVNDWIGAQK